MAQEFEDARYSIQLIVLDHYASGPFIAKECPIYFGHGGLSCPSVTHDNLIHIVDANGIHGTRVRFCECTPDDRSTQLLKAGFFPGTLTHPQVAFSFDLLKHFHRLHLESKVSAYDFVDGLRRLAGNTFALPATVGINLWQ